MDERIAKQFTISKASPVLIFSAEDTVGGAAEAGDFSGRGQAAADRSGVLVSR